MDISLHHVLERLAGLRNKTAARVGLMRLIKGRSLTVHELTEAMLAIQEAYPNATEDDISAALRDVEEGVRIFNMSPTEWLAHAILKPGYMQEPYDMTEQWHGGRLRWVTSHQVIKLPGVKDHFVGQPQVGYWLHRLGLMCLGSPVARLSDGTRAQRWAITDYFLNGAWKR